MSDRINDPCGRVWVRKTRTTKDGRRVVFWETKHVHGTDSAIDTAYMRRQIRSGNLTRHALGGPKYWEADPE